MRLGLFMRRIENGNMIEYNISRVCIRQLDNEKVEIITVNLVLRT